MSVVSGRRLTGFLAGLRRRIRVLCQPRSENCPGLPIFFGEAGRPKRRPITDCYIEMACQKMLPDMCKQLAMKRGSTYAQAMVRGQFIKAIKGEVRNASEIRQAIE